jgi:hypothetical protein
MICLSCAILLWFCPQYHIHFIWFCLWHLNYRIPDLIGPMILPLLSVLPNIYAMWCHIFDGISACVMAPEQQNGAGWESQAPGTGYGLAIANVTGTGAEQWRPQSSVWTCCNGCCASGESLPLVSHWKKEIFELDLTLNDRTWISIIYTVLQPKLATYSSLVSCSFRQSSSGLGHSGLQFAFRLSQPGKLRITVRLAQPNSHWICQVAVVYEQLVHYTARALIIEILLHTAHFR